MSKTTESVNEVITSKFVTRVVVEDYHIKAKPLICSSFIQLIKKRIL